MINRFKLKNLSTLKEIKFHTGKKDSRSITVGNIKFKNAGGESKTNFASNFGGFDSLIGISFTLHDDGTDKSTTGDNIITLVQQDNYLFDVIVEGVGAGDSQSNVKYLDGPNPRVDDINIINIPSILSNPPLGMSSTK